MIVLLLRGEKLLNFGHGKLRNVMEKVVESHVSKSTNPAVIWPTKLHVLVSFPSSSG